MSQSYVSKTERKMLFIVVGKKNAGYKIVPAISQDATVLCFRQTSTQMVQKYPITRSSREPYIPTSTQTADGAFVNTAVPMFTLL
jgi:hypothetical protein